MKLLRRLVREEEGQGLVEYAMILGLVALIVALALQSVGLGIEALFTRIDNGLGILQGMFGP
jgi:pilus assembly protein Flp/PilA